MMPKFGRKRLVYTIAVSILLFATPVLAAFTSDTFRTEAQEHYQKECKKSTERGEDAMLCFLFLKIGEIDNALTALTERVDSLETEPSPSPVTASAKDYRVSDANGLELGVVIDREKGTTFYNEAIDKIMTVDWQGSIISSNNGVQPRRQVHFESNNCTGQGYYFPDAQDDLFESAGRVWTVGTGTYFFIQGITPATITPLSRLVWDDGQLVVKCLGSVNRALEMYPVTFLDIPFTEPVSLPLEYSFE